MKIYNSTETNFNNNGLGFIPDVLEANVVEYLNGENYLQFTYIVGGANSEYLEVGNIIKCNISSTKEQLFRIEKVVKTYTKITVYAPHIFYDLKNNILLNVQPTNLNAQTFGEWILNRTQIANTFTFQSDILGTKSAKYVRRNPIEAIMGDIDNSMINLFGGDIERDNFTIKLLANRGSENKIKVLFGKNIKEIKITADISSMYTRVLPLGFDGLMLPEVFVDSPLIDDYPAPRIGKVEFPNIKVDPNDESAYQTQEEAYEAMREAVMDLYDKGLDKPAMNIKIDWLELSKTEEYKNYSSLEKLHIGDTVIANILGLDYETRIISTTYNVLTDTIENFEIGSVSKNIASSINQVAKSVESVNVSSILETARQNATNQIANAMGGYVYKTNEELYIMDTDDPETAQKVWRWNLNGLGYSNTGFNGNYDLAMTQDGSIVADFITAGTLDVSVIEGFSEIISRVNASATITDINNAKTELNSIINQKNDELLIAIQKIESGETSVGNVITTTAKLDQDGLTIEKTDSPTSSLLDEKGFYIKDSNNQEILKAGYETYIDSGGNEQSRTIVRARDMQITKYLEVEPVRFEKYIKDNETLGCFWIGE